MEAAAGSEGNAAEVLWDQRERGSSGPDPKSRDLDRIWRIGAKTR